MVSDLTVNSPEVEIYVLVDMLVSKSYHCTKSRSPRRSPVGARTVAEKNYKMSRDANKKSEISLWRVCLGVEFRSEVT